MTNGPAATVGGSSRSICHVRATAFSWRTTAGITICQQILHFLYEKQPKAA